MTTIQMDVAANEDTASEFDAPSAFLAGLEGRTDEDASKKKPSAEKEDEDEGVAQDENESNDDSDESPEGDEGDDESGDTEGKDKSYVESDDTYVKLVVDGKEAEVSVKDLKRLYGQEASLTRKSQEVAETRKAAETEAAKHSTALTVLLERAKEKADQYRNIDWMAVSKDPEISAEAASALRAEAQRALEDESFLSQNLNGFMTELNSQQQASRVESAKACVKALTTPGTDAAPNPTYIEGWNEKVYDEVRAFGVKTGLPTDTVNTLTDPAALKLMHMALLYSKGASKVQTTKVNKTPTKITKTSSSAAATRNTPGTADRKAALAAQRKSGGNSVEANVNAFMVSLGAGSEND